MRFVFKRSPSIFRGRQTTTARCCGHDMQMRNMNEKQTARDTQCKAALSGGVTRQEPLSPPGCGADLIGKELLPFV